MGLLGRAAQDEELKVGKMWMDWGGEGKLRYRRESKSGEFIVRGRLGRTTAYKPVYKV